MSDEQQRARGELDELRGLAKKVSAKEARDGSWFTPFLFRVMKGHASEVTPETLAARYPGWTAEAILEARVERAKRWAAVAGGASGVAMTGLVTATVGTAGLAGIAALPAAAAAFLGETMFQAKLQLHLAYDVAMLCSHPVDLEDPDALEELLRAAFGVKAGEAFDQGLAKSGVTRTARRKLRELAEDPAAVTTKALPSVGKFLLKRNIVKFCIPFANIPITAAMNYMAIGNAAEAARAIYDDKARLHRTAQSLVTDATQDAELLLQLMVLVARADGDVEPEEAWLLEEVCGALSDRSGADEAQRLREHALSLQEPALLEALGSLPPPRRAIIYEAAVEAALADHVLRPGEATLLERIAASCEIPYDEESLRARATAPRGPAQG